jgi:hypothetical protein
VKKERDAKRKADWTKVKKKSDAKKVLANAEKVVEAKLRKWAEMKKERDAKKVAEIKATR